MCDVYEYICLGALLSTSDNVCYVPQQGHTDLQQWPL